MLSLVLSLPALRRSLVSLAYCIAALLVANLAPAAITDDGQVVLEPDGSLSIGSDAYGRRTVDAEADGAYPAASLGLLEGGRGELVLTGDASFETTGHLNVGVGGAALLDLSEGSELRTGSASIDGFGPQVRVSGSGTEWTNTGLLRMTANSSTIDLDVANGAHLESGGVFSDTRWAEITIEGQDTLWTNHGELALFGNAIFTVRDGATATDEGVLFGNSFWDTNAVVEGVGSLWRTGPMTVGSNGLDAFVIRDGALVESTSAYFFTQTIQQTIIRGAGSTWTVDDQLSVIATAGPGGSSGVRVEDGGLLSAGHSAIGAPDGGGNGWVDVVGPGSRFHTAGELRMDSDWSDGRASIAVLDGGELATGTMRVACGAIARTCQVNVSGTDSRLMVAGNAVFTSDVSDPNEVGVWTIQSGGHVEAGLTFSVEGTASVRLAGGTLAAAQLALRGGSLSGDGSLQGDVENAGLVSPGASIGHLIVDGSYSQDADGGLSITLGGLTPGVSHDILEVLGASVLAGKLRVELESGYLPTLGDSFQILSAASVSGTFDYFEGLEISPSLSLMVDYLPDGVRLVTVVPVPEPGAALLMMTGLLGLACRQRRHGRAAHGDASPGSR